MKKTILYLTLLTLALMSPARAGAETIDGSNLVWTYSDGTLTFSKGTGSGNAVIPDIDYSSTDHWRAYAGDVTSVVIGDGITTIGLNAFNGFSELKTVSFGKDVQTIDQYAFSYCGAMETITLPASLTKICETAFGYCYELKSINIPDAVTDIEQHAFNECEKLEEVTIGNNVANIGHYAFQNCRTLKTVYMKPATPPTLGCYDIFYNCGGKPERIIVPDGKVDAYKEKYAAFDWKDKIVDEVTGLWNSDGTRDGTAEHPYLITTTMGLDLLASKVNSGTEYGRDDTHLNGYYFELGADIAYSYTTDCDKATSTENNYTAIGCYISDSEDYYFKGHFDGCSHTVSGIRIYKGSNGLVDCSQGLFGQIGAGGSVSHLTLDDARITGKSGVGGIVGFNEDGTITDCHVTENVYIHAVKDNADNHGGIVGYNYYYGAIVSGCTSRAHITLDDNASNCLDYGGIAGNNIDGTIKDCLYLGGQVDGNSDVGAIAGYNNDGTIENCYFKTLTDGSGNGNSNVTAMDEIYPAIGGRDGEVTESNNAYARTITLANDVALGGTTTNYAKDVVNPSQYLTAYATDGHGFALAHTIVGTETTTALYSVKDATVSVKPSGQLDDGITPTFIVTKSQGGTVEVSSDNSVYTFLMPADNVSVSMLTGVKVTVGAQSFATYYSSQAVSLGSGQTDCALYTLSSVSTTAVTLSEISGVASKETPLLVWNGSDTPQDILLSFAPAPATTTEHADEFVGTLAATDVTTLTNATVYVLYNNMFMRATTGSIPANRAYIALSAGSNARALSIGTVTGITPPLTPPLKGAGNAADGLSKGAGNVYDMQGRKVSDGDAGRGLRKGVYITNGKKIIITNKK